ncbi:MAG: glycosyltransferase family 9 protein [Elusimicrobia bacterium]|nr:glycosyltransferase family 9 protein [Elusimicrobiota bacterium]
MGAKRLGKSLEKGGKALLRASLVRLLPRPRRPAGPVDPASVRRVLAVRHDARLGNVLLLTPALRLLKTAFPAARVEVLLADKYGAALAFNPCVDEVLTARALPGLRRRRYDLAFDFSPQHAFSLSSASWTALSGAKRRIGFDRGDAARFLDDLVPVPAERTHETANLARLVRHAAPGAPLPPDAALRTEWHFGPGEREAGARTWREWGLDAESVALFLGARAEKRLPPEWFLELARRLRAAGRRVVLTGGPAERELLKGLVLPDGVRAAPERPLRDFAAAIANARAVLTADTGPMHLAVAVGTPTVELFSHTEPWRFGYAHVPGHVVLDAAGRHPSVDEAWAALSGLLASPRS